MFQVYSWRGTPIHDIRAWARERGEQMVVVEYCRKDPWMDPPYYIRICQEEEMPESFWAGHMAARAGGGSSESWTELRRYDP